MPIEDLISGMLREENGFQKAFRAILDDELKMTVNEFCAVSGISQSTMYKIMEERREPNLRTVRQIVKAIRLMMTPSETAFIAIIASHQVLQTLARSIEIRGHDILLKEYPVANVEDAIIAAVRAERDGALAVVCAPIVAPTVEKILTIPVSPVMPSSSIMNAVDRVREEL